MMTVIELLETIGQDAALRYATRDELGRALGASGVEASTLAAVVGADRAALAASLGVEANPCCLIVVPEEEDSGEG